MSTTLDLDHMTTEREAHSEIFNECDEDDPLLSALDDAVEQADSLPSSGSPGEEIRERITEWTSK
jgi:hypothetical protein